MHYHVDAMVHQGVVMVQDPGDSQNYFAIAVVVDSLTESKISAADNWAVVVGDERNHDPRSEQIQWITNFKVSQYKRKRNDYETTMERKWRKKR